MYTKNLFFIVLIFLVSACCEKKYGTVCAIDGIYKGSTVLIEVQSEPIYDQSNGNIIDYTIWKDTTYSTTDMVIIKPAGLDEFDISGKGLIARMNTNTEMEPYEWNGTDTSFYKNTAYHGLDLFQMELLDDSSIEVRYSIRSEYIPFPGVYYTFIGEKN